MGHGSAHRVIHDVLQFHKVSARWVPWQLTPEMKWCVDTCKELVWCLEAEGNLLLFENRHWQLNLGALTPTGNKQNKQEMVSFPHHQNPRSYGHSHLQGR
jgi:hypothetical protein